MGHRKETYDEFLLAYREYVTGVLKPTQDEITSFLATRQNPAHWSRHLKGNRVPIPSPIRTVRTRIKRPEQVVDKVLRKPHSFPAGLRPESFRRMHDALGVRVVVYFLSHLTLIDRELRDAEELEVSRREPPVAYMNPDQARLLGLEHLQTEAKESGYSSLHYLVRLRESSVPEGDRPWFEIQVRTFAQELWSEVEHHLGYKPGRATSISARRQLQILSKHISAIDDHFNFLYEELNRFQQEVRYHQEDPLNAENLPSVLAEFGLTCAQRDLNNIIKFLYSRGVERVGDLRSLASPRRLDIIRHTYLSVSGRPPTPLEVVASLAAVAGARTEQEEIRSIKSQIAYRGVWESIRRQVELETP